MKTIPGRSRFGHASRGWVRVGLAVAVVFGLTYATSAVAEDVARALTPSAPLSTSNFSTLRDPMALLDETRVVLPRAVLPLTLEDAVAEELLMRSKTLAEEEVLRVASVLCNEAERLGFDPFMLLAVIRIESNYNHLAISPVGAEGLMQLMPYTAVWFSNEVGLDWGDGHSFDPELNVRLGARYLHTLRHQFRGRMDRALTAYNRGPSATWAIIGKHGALPVEIRDFYATKVLDQYQQLRWTYRHLEQRPT